MNNKTYKRCESDQYNPNKRLQIMRVINIILKSLWLYNNYCIPNVMCIVPKYVFFVSKQYLLSHTNMQVGPTTFSPMCSPQDMDLKTNGIWSDGHFTPRWYGCNDFYIPRYIPRDDLFLFI